jgi:hypothetical protein
MSRPAHLASYAAAPSEPGDEQYGAWSRAQLLRMDARFCVVMAREHGSRPDLVNGHRRPTAADSRPSQRSQAGVSRRRASG